jgi:hypothetical protein
MLAGRAGEGNGTLQAFHFEGGQGAKTGTSVLCRACGHDRLAALSRDLTTWKRDVAYLTGVPCAGYVRLA